MLKEKKEIDVRQIDRIAAVLRSNETRSGAIFVGWAKDWTPLVTDTQHDLSPSAQESLQHYMRAGLKFRTINFSAIYPVEYIMTQQGIHFKNAQDLISYKVKNPDSKERNVSITESTILHSIVDARMPWQDASKPDSFQLATNASSIYTVIASPNEMDGRSALAILFRPTGNGNETTFRSFVLQTIDRLLEIESGIGAEERKGYSRLLTELSAGDDSFGKSLKHLLSDMGLYNLGTDEESGGFRKNILGIAKSLKLWSFEENEGININSIQLEKLFELVAKMSMLSTRRQY